MKVKNVVSLVLLLFVAASVVYLVAAESRSRSEPSESATSPAVTKPASAQGNAEPADAPDDPIRPPEEVAESPAEPAAPQHKLIAYYFHRTQRCRKCLTIERYTYEVLNEAFPEAVGTGELEWHSVNVEEPANEHFVQDFQLTASALVLVDTQDGEQKEWRNLARVWELVRDELKFKAYVEAEAMAYLESGS